VLEGLASEKFPGDESLAVLVVDFVNRADVWVIQSGNSLGLALETAEGLGISGYGFGKEFECNKTAELDVLGFLDHAHAAATEFFDDAVVGDDLPNEGRGVRHLADMLG